MFPDAFSSALSFVTTHGYFFVFLGMFIEGPLITASASFGSALGYLSLPIIFVLSILGDIVADFLYYGIGYVGRTRLIDKLIGKFGLTRERLENIEKLLHGHSVKTIVALKLSPLIPAPGFMIVGASRLSFRRFSIICLLVTLPKTIFFVIVGYYFGYYYPIISHYTGATGSIVGISLILLSVLYFYKQTARETVKNLVEKL